MRIQTALAGFGIAFLTSCAGHAPAPNASAPEPLATWNGGSISQLQWDNWKKTNLAKADPKDLGKGFDDYLRNNLDAQAALESGSAKDSTKTRRWSSIVDRILSDVLRREYLYLQAGFPDSAILRWAATQDSATRALPLDTLRARGGMALLLKGVNLDSVYQAHKSEYKKDSVTFLPFDSVKSRVRETAYHNKLDNLVHEYLPGLRTKYGVKVPTIERPAVSQDTLKAYWKANPDRWTNAPVYRLAALGSKDSASLAKAISGIKSLDAFRKLSAKFKVGTPAAPDGELGRVKHQFSLPYGIGMVPSLFSYVDTAKVGHLVSATIRANDSLFLAVWLEGRDSASIKPYESVKAEVASAYNESNPYTPPAATVMASWDKGPLFTKGDVDFISEEVPPQMKRQFPPSRVLDFMINWAVGGRVAREVGLLDRPLVKATLNDNEKIFWAQEFRNGVASQTFLFPKQACDSALVAWMKTLKNWVPDTSKGANRDGARFLLLNPGEFEQTYSIGLDSYRQDSAFLPLDSVRTQVLYKLRATLDERGLARTDSVLKARFHLHLSASAPRDAAKLAAKEALDSARAKHDRRSLEEAQALYKQVADDATAPDSLRSQSLFQLGQLYGEQQNYPRSLEAYRSVLVRFPKSAEAYKAQFMVAFTYSEYMKINKIAVEEYRKVLANYPKCDLANDADWMIRNILSGGALMPKFDDSAFVADSIARADSLKKAGAKDTAKAKPSEKSSTEKPLATKPAAGSASPVSPVAKPKIDTTKATKPSVGSGAK